MIKTGLTRAIRPAGIADAKPISCLIASLSDSYLSVPTDPGIQVFLESISVDQIRKNLASPSFNYWVCEQGSEVVGVMGLRQRSHVFHFFVAKEFQGQGIGKQLWECVDAEWCEGNGPLPMTVNATLKAVPVYRRLGFIPAGPECTKNGITFLPMHRL